MATEVGTTAAKATHVGGAPACGITDAGATADARAPTGGLFGGVIIVNPAGGGAFSQAATALDNFYPTNFAGAYQNTGSRAQRTSTRATGEQCHPGGTLYSSIWANGNDAVTAVLLGNAVTNEYVLDTGTKSQTSWIITMPTKYAYVNRRSQGAVHVDLYHPLGACEPTFAVVFNREEASPQIVTSVGLLAASPGPAWTDDLLRSHLRELSTAGTSSARPTPSRWPPRSATAGRRWRSTTPWQLPCTG